jgi:hypothetical protein
MSRSKIEKLTHNVVLEAWQSRWESSPSGRTTFNFFPSVRQCLNSPWIIPDHLTTQFLSGHGKLNSKLFNLNIVESPSCCCGHLNQTSEHILLSCPFPLLIENRKELLDTIRGPFMGPVGYTDLVSSNKNFKSFKKFCNFFGKLIMSNQFIPSQ